jgi:hypothetical protein
MIEELYLLLLVVDGALWLVLFLACITRVLITSCFLLLRNERFLKNSYLGCRV